MSVRIHCPFCNQPYDVDDFSEEVVIECANCSLKFPLDKTLVDSMEQSEENPAFSASAPSGQERTSFKPHIRNNAVETPEIERREERSISVPGPSGKLSLILTNVLLLIVAIILGLQMFRTDKQVEALSEQLTNIHRQMTSINGQLETMSHKSNPIVGYKIINYTWEYSYSMEAEFRNAIKEGYEPVGYVCQNSLKGGFFLFIKREK